MELYLITTNFDRVLSVRADGKAEALKKINKCLAPDEIILVVELI